MPSIWRSLAALLLLFCASGGAHAQQQQCPLTMTPKIITATTYKVDTTDNCWYILLTSASPITVQLPAPGLIFPPGFTTTLLPLNSGNITFTGLQDDAGKTHQINGLTQLSLVGGQGAILKIQQDLNWYALPTGATGNLIGTANFLPTPAYGLSNTTIPQTLMTSIMGSVALPDINLSPSVVIQKTLGSATGGPPYASLYTSMRKTTNVSAQSARAILAEAYDTAGWSGGSLNFIEGTRSSATCGPGTGGAVCYAYGVVAVATNQSAGLGVIVGVESEIDSSVPASNPLNPGAFSTSYLATPGTTFGTTHPDAAFLINPNNTPSTSFQNGFKCPAGNVSGGSAASTVGNACFEAATPSPYSLDAHLAGETNGAIWIPRNTYILASDNAGVPRHMLIMSATNDEVIGFDDALNTILLGAPATNVPIILNSKDVRLPQLQTPASAAATCVAGRIEFDVNFIYACVGANTWKRVAIATW